MGEWAESYSGVSRTSLATGKVVGVVTRIVILVIIFPTCDRQEYSATCKSNTAKWAGN